MWVHPGRSLRLSYSHLLSPSPTLNVSLDASVEEDEIEEEAERYWAGNSAEDPADNFENFQNLYLEQVEFDQIFNQRCQRVCNNCVKPVLVPVPVLVIFFFLFFYLKLWIFKVLPAVVSRFSTDHWTFSMRGRLIILTSDAAYVINL